MGALAESLRQRILTLDIERTAGLVHRFQQKESAFVPVSRWVRLPSLLCFAAKWYDRRTIEFHAAWDDVEAMVCRSWQLYDEADIVVGYNSVKFDNKFLRSAWLEYGLGRPSPWKNVDLYTVNRQTFGRESYSLNHLAQQLGIEGKSGHYDPKVADACMEGDRQAQREMRQYNKGDVRVTEACYIALRSWMSNHPHVNTTSGDEITCNVCGGRNVTRLPKPYRADAHEYAAYRCDDCQNIIKANHIRRVARTRGVPH